MVTSVEGPKVIGEGLAFHPSGSEFCVAARDQKRCIELFNYGERKSLGNIVETFANKEDSKKPGTIRKREVNGSLFYYSVRYLDANWIAFCGSHQGALELINQNAKKPETQVMPSITGLEQSINCIDSFRKKIMFIVQNEVACAEIFE